MDKQLDIFDWQVQNAFNYDTKRLKAYTDNRRYCKCGHSVVMLPNQRKKLCSWCGHWIFKTKKDEFLYRVKECMK